MHNRERLPIRLRRQLWIWLWDFSQRLLHDSKQPMLLPPVLGLCEQSVMFTTPVSADTFFFHALRLPIVSTN